MRSCGWIAAGAFVLASAAGDVACRSAGGVPSPPPGVSVASITVTSDAFRANGTIPVEYTCDGKEIMPSLTWSAPPPNTKALVVIIDDPDAPGGTFTHFVAWDLPADLRSIKEGTDVSTLGAKIGANDGKSLGYKGPCPPQGEEHRYDFRVLATDRPLGLRDGASRADVDNALVGHLLGEGTLSALFGH